MSAGAGGPLERRYRRLLRLLPADHRAARGEELLGLLLDLDEGRRRPSLRQAAGVVGLALRLRLAGTASLLLAAFLVAYSTEVVQTVYRVAAVGWSVTPDQRLPVHNVALALLIPGLLRLGLAVAWILGAGRTALGLLGGVLVWSLINGGLFQFDLAALLLLGAGVLLRWPAPRTRGLLLAAIPLAMLLWALLGAHELRMPSLELPAVTGVVAVAGALSRRRAPRPGKEGIATEGIAAP